MSETKETTVTALQRIAYLGWKHRFDEGERGEPTSKEARVGFHAMAHILRDPTIKMVSVWDEQFHKTRSFVWGGVTVTEDPKTPRDEVRFIFEGREIGRIVGLSYEGDGIGQYQPKA